MTEPTVQDAVPEPQTSDFQQELIAAGATPQFPNVEQMLAQMAAMQKQIDALNAERGVPANPIEGAKVNLLDHIKARAAQLPGIVVDELKKTIESLPDVITTDHTSLIMTLVEELLSNSSPVAHELSYLPELARDFHKAVLKDKVAA